MRYRPSEKTIIKLLTTIAEKKEFAQYDMQRAIGKNYRTVLRYVPKLESCRLIQLSRTENSRKRGKDRKIYAITLLGIIELLKTKVGQTKDFVQLTDRMAQLHPKALPLIFGKWQFFDQNQKILLSLRLKDVVKQTRSHMYTLTSDPDVKALHEEIEEEKRANVENEDHKTDENPQSGSIGATTAQSYETVATGETAIRTMLKLVNCGSHDLKEVEEKVTKSVLSEWRIDIEIDPQGNLLIDELTEDYFRKLAKDKELRSFMNQEMSYAEESTKTKLVLVQKFNQWWKDLGP